MNKELEKFRKLCDKAQEILFDALCNEEQGKFAYLAVQGLPDKIVDMTPIEQIFCVANDVNFENELISEPQAKIVVNDKIYITDFVIYGVYKYHNGTIIGNFEMNKPIIIELDGYEYHSDKQQVNYDYERETNLKLAGYDVLRFTGSQIYNNVWECLKKIYQFAMQNKEV